MWIHGRDQVWPSVSIRGLTFRLGVGSVLGRAVAPVSHVYAGGVTSDSQGSPQSGAPLVALSRESYAESVPQVAIVLHLRRKPR